MFRSNSKHVLQVCILVFTLVLVQGRYSRRSDNRYNSGWDMNNSGGGGQNSNFQDEHKVDYEATGIAMKKALGLTKVVLSPIVLPMIFFVGIVLLLFFAVVGSSAVVGGALGRNKIPYSYRSPIFAKQFSSTAKLARDVLSSDECVERISCEIFRKARSFHAENWIMRTLESIPSKNNWIGRISRSLKNTSDCQKYNCPSASYVSTAMKMVRG